ncbi:HTH domain-containing protein [Schinkia azotoformans]|uniref:HTH domain-containing protein n=1 Tax=Schinkia azotoformans TaxID=1454 RepID=UPI002DBABD31|nr:HTH domain-containing protein [Schinkia azotoformans]MEC1717871.1 HTH domain-containing protein [Schinkia azotoformans]MEC1739720.1 HTH domain-containing protein [Schinkia azotoformans]MEC1757962.1 HTH domain-containing protein [Schinkia azotoformans]MEC1767255.1 HTH domain-containing protein [Schinkia azotoformans]MEC1789191.1 HTH domain-containing protein [Schinkia azotoformans]
MQVQVSNGNNTELIPILLKKADYESGIDSLSLLSLYVFAIQSKYKRYLIGISPSDNTVFKQNTDIDTNVIDALNNGLESMDVSVENFAQVKYALDKFFYDITVKGTLIYTYQKSYLISSSELGKRLNISRATIHRYKELGLESVDSVGHNSYPRHNEFYWKDGVWSSRIQALFQGFKIRNQTKKELIVEIEHELNLYKKEYGGTFEEVFGNITDPYQLDEPDDYFDWKELSEDLKRLFKV